MLAIIPNAIEWLDSFRNEVKELSVQWTMLKQVIQGDGRPTISLEQLLEVAIMELNKPVSLIPAISFALMIDKAIYKNSML